MLTYWKSAIIVFAAIANFTPGVVTAQDAYEFNLTLSSVNATTDPDNVWTDRELAFYKSQGFEPKIYTAWATTPAGQWLLTQTNGDCNMQGMCTTLLFFKKNGKSRKLVSSAQVQEGGKAFLSLNYKRLTSIEIDQNGHEFMGSYEVESVQ